MIAGLGETRDQGCPERRDGAGAADDHVLAVDPDVVPGLWVSGGADSQTGYLIRLAGRPFDTQWAARNPPGNHRVAGSPWLPAI
jgi:hypothetical protein